MISVRTIILKKIRNEPEREAELSGAVQAISWAID